VTDDPLLWLTGRELLGMKFGLENMAGLMHELGEPHHSFPSVLVAGTNGKGSVTAIVDAALRAAGYRSARYTSPHLERIEERFVVDGREVATGALREAVASVQQAAERLCARGARGGEPTFFEAATAAAFELFRTERVDIAVVEVGLGGRLDATNVLHPLVTAITTIDFDHQAQLGNTIAEIAREKAGILKQGVPVVVGRVPPDAAAVIREMALAVGAPQMSAQAAARRLEGRSLALRGSHQRDNAMVAIAVLDALATRGFEIPGDAVAHALAHVEWPGRLEHRRYGTCDVLLDAAHNPAGARALAAYLREAEWSGATLVFGAMADKDAPGMLRELAPAVGRIVCTTPPTPRAASASALAREAAAAGAAAVDAVDDPLAALERACRQSSRVVVAGSMFLIGPLRGILR